MGSDLAQLASVLQDEAVLAAEGQLLHALVTVRHYWVRHLS